MLAHVEERPKVSMLELVYKCELIHVHITNRRANNLYTEKVHVIRRWHYTRGQI